MTAILNGTDLTLSGDVGEFLYGDGFTHSDVVIALAQVDDAAPLTVFLNSGGGYASEGAAIHATLASRRGKTEIVIEGIAASAASLVAMAGDTVTMSAGSILMIHDPAAITAGTSSDHAKTINGLEALATAYARVYAAKSGKGETQCREIMKAETWFTPSQAVAAGFADRTTEKKAGAIAAFDYRAYAHAPQDLRAMASLHGWDRPLAPAADARRNHAVAAESAIANMRKVAGIAEPKKPAPAAATSTAANMQALLRGQGRL